MNKSKIYVGNLPYNTTDEELQEYFTQFGDVNEVKIIIDRRTNRSKGFGFVTFASEQAAEASLETDGKDFGGRSLKVNIAREESRSRDGSNGGGWNR